MKFQWTLLTLFTFYFALLEAQDFIDVQVGTTVELKCVPTSNIPSIPTIYEWYDPQNKPKSTNINLVIQNFSYENQGLYTCKATQIIEGRPARSEKSVYVKIKGSVGNSMPQVIVSQTYSTFSTGILFLLCKSSTNDNDKYKIEWITPSGEKHSTSTYFKNYASLADSGRYLCRITRKADGYVIEGQTIVTVNDLPIKITTQSGSMEFGSTISLNCEIDRTKTEQRVFGQFLYSWEDPQNRIISNTPVVHITLDNISKFGAYQCKIIAPAIKPPYKTSKTIELRYSRESTSGDRQTVTTYTGRFNSNPSNVRYFEPLELNCEITPQIADVTYQIIFNQQLLTTSNSYKIPQLGKENLGSYECHITGKDFRTGQTVNLKATFTIQPEYTSGSKIELAEPPGPQIFVRNGDKRELHCEIPQNSKLTGSDAMWYFNGSPINPTNFERYNLQVLARLSVSIVVLKNIQTLNEGKYECRVKGETKEAYILVMSKTLNIEVNPAEENRRVGDGRPVEFHCRIDGYNSKNADIIWKFASRETNVEVPLDSRWKRTDEQTADETSFIELSQAEERDTGTYICLEPKSQHTARAVLTVTSGLRIVVTPPIIRLRTGQTANFECYTLNGGSRPEYPEFYKVNGPADNSRMVIEKLEMGKVRLIYRDVTTSDNGTSFNCRLGSSSSDALILVSPICPPGYRLCRNGECISASKFCDGKQDCSDGSDEDQQFCRQCDPLSKQCEVHNGQEPTNRIFQAHWSCDGEDDCGNGYDESKCFGHVLECGGLTYRCSDGTKTIPKAFVCDKDNDCLNGDEETKCVSPQLISEPPGSYLINARRGETVELTCQVTGYPLPKIIWRFNWGCLSVPERMIVTETYQNCGSTISILRISNFQPGDDGIYNCEGLSGGKRAWSKDYQLMMNFRI